MQYAFVTFCHSDEWVRECWPWIPRMCTRFVLSRMPPRELSQFEQLVGGAQGVLLVLPATPGTLAKSPSSVEKSLHRARDILHKAHVVAVDPLLSQIAGLNAWPSGNCVSAASSVSVLKSLIRARRPERDEMVVLGAEYSEVVALAACLSEDVSAVHVSAADRANMESVATGLWRSTGIGVRIHKCAEYALSRSRIVLIASRNSWQKLNGIRPGSVLVDLRYPWWAARTINDSLVQKVQGPWFCLPPTVVSLNPSSVTAILEAGARCRLRTRVRFELPGPNDLTIINRFLLDEAPALRGFWHNPNLNAGAVLDTSQMLTYNVVAQK